MDTVFRESFGTGSKAAEIIMARLKRLIYGEPTQPAGQPAAGAEQKRS